MKESTHLVKVLMDKKRQSNDAIFSQFIHLWTFVEELILHWVILNKVYNVCVQEDVQLMIQQQLQTQQLAEQSQKKNLRGLLRRNKPPVQRPPNFPMPSPAPPSTTNANQIYVNRPTAAPPAATKPSQVYVQRPSAAPTGGPSATSASSTLPRNWKDRLRKGRSGHQELEVGRVEDGFQVVSLD